MYHAQVIDSFTMYTYHFDLHHSSQFVLRYIKQSSTVHRRPISSLLTQLTLYNSN